MNFQAIAIVILFLIVGAVGLTMSARFVALDLSHRGNHKFEVGTDDASIKIVFFFDYKNPASRRIYNKLLQLRGRDQDVQIVLRDLPDSSTSEVLSRVAIAAGEADNLYKGFFNHFMRMNADELDQPVSAIKARLKVDQDAIEQNMHTPKTDRLLKYNRVLAKILGYEQAPILIIDNEVIAHDGYDTNELLRIIDTKRAEKAK